MIDYDFEERLVDRIAAREAIAARLTPRQRHVLRRCYRYGETYREVGARDGVSATRINQIHDKAVRLLGRGFAPAPKIAAAAPTQTTRNTPPLGFDRAAFLRHMRGLIAKREEHARYLRARDEEEARTRRKRERDALDRIMRNEESAGLFDPPPPQPKTPPNIRPPVQYAVHPAQNYAPPWKPPTETELSHIAHDALQYLLLTRPPEFPGLPYLGKWCTSVIFPIEGGIKTVAVDKLNAELPHHARLSAYPVEIPKGTVGANATTPHAAMRVTLSADGLQIRFDVTWD